MINNIIKTIVWIIFLGGLGYGLHFFKQMHDQTPCKGADITVYSQKGVALTDSAAIRNIIDQSVDTLTKTPLHLIPVEKIERALQNNPFIENVDVITTVSGYLKVKVKSYNPVLRIISNANSSFFIDRHGVLIPSKPLSSAHTPFASGHLNISLADSTIQKNYQINSLAGFSVLKEIFNLAAEIRSSTFLAAQIEQIYVNPSGEYELIPKVGDQVILLGDLTNLNNKLKKLEAFYKQAMPVNGWNKYKSINLKYKNQVVCSKI
jgi:cell division protein FtsQ